MKILQVANFYGPTSGGLRTTVDALGAGYRQRGHERLLIVPGPADADEETPSGRRVSLRSPGLPGSGGYRVLTDRSRLEAIVTEERPDVVEVSDKALAPWLARQAARIGARTVLLSHERIDAILGPRVPSKRALRRGADLWNRRLLGAFDAVVCTSRWSAEEFGRLGGSPVVVPLGVDLEVFRPSGEAVEGATPTLVCLGRLSKEKSPGLAVAAVAELIDRGRDVRLVMVGAGPLEDRLRHQAAGLPVSFTGHLPAPEVARLLASASALVAPCAVESFGLAVLEALACGTPVIVPDGGAARELLADGAGAATPSTAAAMADGVIEVLSWPAARRRRATRRRAEAYDWDTTVSAMVTVHEGRQVAWA